MSWRLWRDFHNSPEHEVGHHTITTKGASDHPNARPLSEGGVRRAIGHIIVADLSMSLDNVLAVAGAAMNHVWVLAIGLMLSVALMCFAAMGVGLFVCSIGIDYERKIPV